MKIHLFINALSATAGGGLTYVRNVVPCLAARSDVFATLAVGDQLRNEISPSQNISVLALSAPSGAGRRFVFEQRELPSTIRRSGADVLLSTGNFSLFRSPISQILLSRNALYTSKDFLDDVRKRGDYRLWLDTKVKGALARWSGQCADCTIAPSETFAAELRDWTGSKNVVSIHHGFNPKEFFRDDVQLPPGAQAQLNAADGALRVLFVSHYNYYRNFESLIRAIALLKQRLRPRRVRLILTCHLESSANPGSYRPDSAAALVTELDLRDEVIQLGSFPYAALHHLYRACDVYVSPAYAETFAHPLVEAMSCGLPVIVSDIPVHHEICGDAALYFSRFSPEGIAGRIVEVAQSEELTKELRSRGLTRSRDFSWDKHVDELLRVARRLAKRPALGALRAHREQ